MRRIALTAAILLLVCSSVGAGPEKQVEYTLDNGLHVTLRPLSTGAKTALVIVHDVGEDNDPEGKSGLSHLVEHCYVTCATGTTPVRTAGEMMARYPKAWNAQTGARYTVVAFIFPKADLAKEVEEAAARMGDLQITQADLVREIPRMREELFNMYDGMTRLAASNRAHARIRPSPGGGRKGGIVEQIETITLADVKAWHAKHYKPANARLVLLGPFDPEEGKALIAKHFGPIEKGEAPPVPAKAPAPRPGPLEVVELQTVALGSPGTVCMAWRAPAPDSPHYASFLALVARMMPARTLPGSQGGAPAAMPMFQILDLPEVFYVLQWFPHGASPEKAAAELRAFVDGALNDELGAGDARRGAQQYAWALSGDGTSDFLMARNPYGFAFGMARRGQLGLDPDAVKAALEKVDQASFDAMKKAVFGEDKCAVIAVVRARDAR